MVVLVIPKNEEDPIFFKCTVLVTSKNKEDPNKNEGSRVATTLNIDFSHSQGQITLQSRLGSG